MMAPCHDRSLRAGAVKPRATARRKRLRGYDGPPRPSQQDHRSITAALPISPDEQER